MLKTAKPIIEVSRLSKHYRIRNPDTGHKEPFWALKDVSFRLQRGHSVGIIGHNGSGKSTLLKIIASIVSPSEGYVTVRGNIASMLELGAGFHQELTGRENTFVYGAMVGLKRQEIKRKFDEIIDFAEIEPFIDTKVRSYSAGMIVRLAFSIATVVQPDVLLADEVLAVGDKDFRKKCFDKMEELRTQGTAMLIVHHDKHVIGDFCTDGLLLDHGKLLTQGSIDDVLDAYQALKNNLVSKEQINFKQV